MADLTNLSYEQLDLLERGLTRLLEDDSYWWPEGATGDEHKVATELLRRLEQAQTCFNQSR